MAERAVRSAERDRLDQRVAAAVRLLQIIEQTARERVAGAEQVRPSGGPRQIEPALAPILGGVRIGQAQGMPFIARAKLPDERYQDRNTIDCAPSEQDRAQMRNFWLRRVKIYQDANKPLPRSTFKLWRQHAP